MSAGPTTEGSIVGYLRLNTSDWNEQLDRAEARARELGRTDPTITVDANTAEAMSKIAAVQAAKAQLGLGNADVGVSGSPAKIDGVAAAQKRLEAAERAAANAASTQYLAELRLEDVQERGGASAYALAAAEEAVARSSRNAEAAENRYIAANTALAAAQTATTEATVASAAAQREDADATTEANATKTISLNRTTLLAAGIAALIPVLAPVAGYAAGVGGALLGMGAAGVLAIMGIKDEMAAGTATGNAYSAGVRAIQDDLKTLEATAAGGLLDGFQRSVAEVDEEMPSLNRNIGTLSGQLGIAADFVTRGLVTGLRVMNPLFVQSSFYVEQLASGFDKWTSNGGLQKFTQMAIASLPQVATALGSLAKGALDLVQGLAPLGSVLLIALTVLGQLLSIVGPLAGDLVSLGLGAGAVYAGFKLWQGISPIIDSVRASVRGVGVDLSAMGGVAGLAVAALGFLASSFITARMESSAAADALQDYTAAVQQDNGVLGENVKAQTAKALADKNSLGQYNSLGISAIQIGKELGLSAQTVTAAADGQKDAIAKVNQVMTDYANNPANSTAKVAAFRANWINLTGVISDNHTKVQDAIKAYNDIASAQGQASISTKAQLNAQQALADRYGTTIPAMLDAEAAQKKNADAAAATTRELQFENDAAGLLTNAFTLLNGGTLDVAQAQTGAAAASNSLVDSLTQNGTAIEDNSKAAVANRQSLLQKVQADQQSAEAVGRQTKSTKAGTDAFLASKQALIDQLTATGQLTPAIQALIDKYYAVPPVVETQARMDAADAEAKTAALTAALQALAGVWTVHVQAIVDRSQLSDLNGEVSGNGRMGTSQSGGFINGTIYRALGGGIPSMFQPRGTDTVPTMLTPGEFVVREQSASVNPGFLKAYNDNPQAALAAVAGRGDSSTSDRPIYADGIGLIGWIREIAGQAAQLIFNQGMNRAAQELAGGFV